MTHQADSVRTLRYGSVCSGIEAVTCAWHDLEVEGYKLEPAWFAEIAPFPSAVLAHHYPEIPNLQDISRSDFCDDAKRYGPIDILVGGSPCQGFSISGKRGGHNDPRSALTFAFVRIAETLRPKIVLWENVPGVFNTNGGRDFGTFLGAMADAGFNRLGWRVLDAQFFGVPQRRRRVFLVGYSGSESIPDAVLFEPQGEGRDSAPRRSTRKKPARTAGGGAAGYDDGRAGRQQRRDPTVDEVGQRVIPCLRAGNSYNNSDPGMEVESLVFQPVTDTASTLQGGGERGSRVDAESAAGGHLVVAEEPVVYQCHGTNVGPMGTLRAGNGNETGGVPFTVQPFEPVCVTGTITHTLTAEGADASCDGTGRGTPIVVQPYTIHGTPATNVATETETHQTLRARVPGQMENSSTTVVVQQAMTVNSAQSCAKQDHAFEADVSRCLDTCGGFASGQGGTVVVESVAFNDKVRDGELQTESLEEASYCLKSTGGHRRVAIRVEEKIESDSPELPCGLYENQRGELYALSTLNSMTTGGGKPGQGYPAVVDAVDELGRPATFRLVEFGEYSEDGMASTLKARDSKDATDLVVNEVGSQISSEEQDDGEVPKTGPGNLLWALREQVGEEGFTEWAVRGLNFILETQILRQEVHGGGIRRPPQSIDGLVNGALPREENRPEGGLLGLWEEFCARRTSQGRGLPEQLAGELTAYLSQLSHEGASTEGFLFALRGASEGIGVLREALRSVQAMGRPEASEARRTTYIVRRLSARECERLQGFPDGWTLIPFKGRSGKKYLQEVVAYLNSTTDRVWTEAEVNGLAADSHRYQALGNSMAVPTIKWLGKRILRVFRMLDQGEPIPREMP